LVDRRVKDQEADGMLTVQCEWFPDLPPADSMTDPWQRGVENVLETEMRLFGSAVRWAFNRLVGSLPMAARSKPAAAAADGAAAPVQRLGTTAEQAAALRLALKRELQATFGLNSRYADDAILKAHEVIVSQRKLIPTEIAQTEAKRERTERKRKANARRLERLRKAGRQAEAAVVEQALRGQQLRLKKLEAKLAVYRRHQAEGTIPAVVFGGRHLWRRLCRSSGAEHRRLRAEWHAARKGRLYSRGEAAKGGNLNLRITLGPEGDFLLSAAISHLAMGRGRAPRVTGRLWVPKKYRTVLGQQVLTGCPYTVEVLRSVDGRWRAHVSFTPSAVAPIPVRGGVVGVDLNPHGVAVANVGPDGNPAPWPDGLAERLKLDAAAGLHKYAGEGQVGLAHGRLWLHVPEMWQAKAERRAYLVGVVAKLVVDAALAVGKPLVHEDLEFAKEHDTNRAFNRYSSHFPYAELAEAIDRRARRCGVPVTLVDPAYTSAEGRWRFAPDLGWSVHQAAALCIGRKALGQRRRFPRRGATSGSEISCTRAAPISGAHPRVSAKPAPPPLG